VTEPTLNEFDADGDVITIYVTPAAVDSVHPLIAPPPQLVVVNPFPTMNAGMCKLSMAPLAVITGMTLS